MTHRTTIFPVSFVVVAAVLCTAIHAADSPQAESLSSTLAERIISASQGFGELGLDVAAAAPGQSAAKLRIKDKEYSSGLGHHADGDILVNLGRQFKTFEAEVGVQWQGGNTPASVVFQVYVDGKKVFDSGVMRENDPSRPVTVSVEGAKELRLVSTNNLGDGISYDSADWANVRLTRNPAAAKESAESVIDIAPFGQVASWDPKVMIGSKAGRVQTFPAEDVAPYKEILPNADGAYQVPVKDGQGCIGLQWDENRMLRRLILQFPNEATVPSAKSIELQYWVGQSAWQGEWQRATFAPRSEGSSLVWPLSLKQMASGTQKVRWVFSETKQPIVIAGISAYSRSLCNTADVRIASTIPNSTAKAEIGVYNGVLLNSADKSTNHCEWNASEPLSLKVLYNVPQRSKVDRTVLQFRLPNTPAFSVAIEDLLTNDCVYVPHAGVFVTRLPAPITLADYLKKIAGKKSVLEDVREKPDQDFSKAWSVVHKPIQNFGSMMISLANDNRKFIAEREGGILFDEYDSGDNLIGSRPGTIYNLAFSVPWRCTPTFGSGKGLMITRHLQGEWLPIPITTTTDGPIVYRQTTCVVPMSEATADAPFWFRDRAMCVAEYDLKNSGNEEATAKFALQFSNDKKKPFQLQEVHEGLLIVEGDRVVALIDTQKAAPLSVKRKAKGVVFSGRLPAGAAAKCIVYFPAWKVTPKDYASFAKVAGVTAKVESYWKAIIEPAMQIDVPDRLLTNIIRASQVHCMLAARCENRGAMISAWTSSDRYGPLESESNPIIRGMDMMGQTDFARRCLDYMLSFCNKDGFITTGYTIVGTGETLWILGECYDRTRDRDWLRKNASELVRICQWVIDQSAKTKRLDARGQKVPEYGLTTPGVSADWDRYAYRLFNDSQYFAGLEAAVRVLADIGDPAAPKIQAEAKQYREDIVRAFRWAQARMPVVQLANGTWVPPDPTLMNCFGRVEDFLPAEDVGRTWCYSIELGAHHLAVTKVFDPASTEAIWMTDFLEDVQFLRTGWCEYPEEENRKDVFSFGGFAKVQPYYCRVAEIYAMRDDVKPFVRSYFNAISSLVNEETLWLWEHFHNVSGWNKTHETGWFLCQTRIMLVNERGDELWLAPFVTNHWLKDGKKVSVRNAPTAFGKVSYTITSSAAKGHIDAVVEVPQDISAKKIVLRLRHPEGKPMQSVTVQGKPHKDFDPQKETITLPPTPGTITIQATY